MSAYILEFEIAGLPKPTNQIQRKHWGVQASHAKRWKRRVWAECWHKRPSAPLARATLTLTRCSSNAPDSDGLVSSFKHVVDGLVDAGVLADDRFENIGMPSYQWERAKPKQGKIIVKVEEK